MYIQRFYRNAQATIRAFLEMDLTISRNHIGSKGFDGGCVTTQRGVRGDE
jgi:hypothetical protein